MLYIKHKDEGCGVICHRGLPIGRKWGSKEYPAENIYQRYDQAADQISRLDSGTYTDPRSYASRLKGTPKEQVNALYQVCERILHDRGFTEKEIRNIMDPAPDDPSIILRVVYGRIVRMREELTKK